MRLLLLLLIPATAWANRRLCPAYFEALADAHVNQLVVADGLNRLGRVPSLDPWTDAERLARDAGVPEVAPGDPVGAGAFQLALENLLRTLPAAAAETHLAAFCAQWGVPRGTLLRMLLPYRVLNGNRYPGLAGLFPDARAIQQALAWLKYEDFLENHPRLRARHTFYAENIGRSSVPEMVAELRRLGDPVISEPLAYKEINALHLSLEAALDRPLTAAERTALLAAGVTGLSPVTTAAEALREGRRAHVAMAPLAGALRITENEAAFFLHFDRTEPRAVLWNRMVRDNNATSAETEESFLRRLHASQFDAVTIAVELNAAASLHGGVTIDPAHQDFRTVNAVSAKLRALGLVNPRPRDREPVVVPGFGTVADNGMLRVPEAVAYIRAQRRLGRPYADIAADIGFSETAVREFERKWSEDTATGLPQVLTRFLDAAPPGSRFSSPVSGGSAAPRPRRAPPPPRADPALAVVTAADVATYQPLLAAMKEAFYGATEDFPRALAKMRADLPIERQTDWDRDIAGIFPHGVPPRLLSVGTQRHPHVPSADRAVRTLQLYARLKGLAQPATGFRDAKDIEAVLTPFGYTTPLVTTANLATFMPLLKALKETFGSTDSAAMLDAFRKELPSAAHQEWDQELLRIGGGAKPSKTLLSFASNAGGDATAAGKLVRIVELWARLSKKKVPDSHCVDKADFEALLKPFGYTETVVTKANMDQYQSLMDALKATFGGEGFPTLVARMREGLPVDKHAEWDRRLKFLHPDGPPVLLLRGVTTKSKTAETFDRILQTVLLYAELKGTEIPETKFSEPAHFEPILTPLGYAEPMVTRATLPEFRPFLKAVQDTFSASIDFSKAVAKMRAALPPEQQAAWDKEIALIFIDLKVADVKLPRAIDEEKAYAIHGDVAHRAVRLYARLKGGLGEARDLRDKKDWEPILKQFGFAEPVVTAENVAEFIPLCRAMREEAQASEQFSRLTDRMRAALPADQHADWDRRLFELWHREKPAKGTFGYIFSRERRPSPADYTVRTLLLFAELKGMKIPANHFRDAAGIEAIRTALQPIP